MKRGFVAADAWTDKHPKLFVVLAIVIWMLILSGVIVSLATNRSQDAALRALTRDGVEAKRALCAYKTDLERRVESTKTYLALHPEGFPALGLSAEVLRNSLINQQKTVESLSGLAC